MAFAFAICEELLIMAIPHFLIILGYTSITHFVLLFVFFIHCIVRFFMISRNYGNHFISKFGERFFLKMGGYRNLSLLLRPLRYRSFGTTQKLRECCEEDYPTKPKEDPCHEGKYKIYRALSLFAALPLILIITVVQFNRIRQEECIKRPAFVPYEFLRIRNKRFPWGEGQKSLFHNSLLNPLPEGYEDELEAKEEEGD